MVAKAEGLAVVLGAGIEIVGFVWWKRRDLRKQLCEQSMRVSLTGVMEPFRDRRIGATG
ncbi:hypothetical protein [Paraburkholderia steynii]|uniref:hypothetical protein n=1 Tax=Paraburkholderia steynii TaxID=1245441 RepID=UPI0014230342|nr:hypothetical protein [Paraburkholderia steynii]